VVNTETSETRRIQQTSASGQASQSVKTAQSGQTSGKSSQQVQNVGPRQVQTAAKKQTAARPKNFMADDDEFEFEFLNWDGSEDK
jgi:hypothetical protein